ncbi:MAG TPA: AMP-binding protein, partial [Acidimicrobiales bacterium]|nr:AMP-binding protein [Acidimicrobiales bacterium]
LWEQLAVAMPDAEAVVQGDVRLTWQALEDRAARVADTLVTAGLTAGSAVAQYLYNSPEYVETYFGALKVRAVPVNVNYRYLDGELEYLLKDSGARALVFHSSLADRVARVAPRCPQLRLLLEVDDGGPGTVPRATPYEAAVSGHSRAPLLFRSEDDVSMTYTGGTTGMPKGVVRRIGPAVSGLLASVPPHHGRGRVGTVTEATTLAGHLHGDGRQPITLPASPLIHATAMVIGMQAGLLLGGKVVLCAGRRFDAAELWDVVERERAQVIAIVGEPFARPMLAALQGAAAIGQHRDLTSVRTLASSGAMFSAESKAGLLGHLPGSSIVDYMSSTEGLMGASVSTKDAVAATGTFRPAPGVRVLAEDDRDVAPGSGLAGLLALSVGVPDGYYNDEAKSARTFREIGGRRYAIPGDWATIDDDGVVHLLGRGAQCINTGGEKIYAEEVEEVIKRGAGVTDCLVLGLPDPQFGQRVAAVVAVERDREITPDLIIGHVAAQLAPYKVPRQVLLVDTVPRAATGKADYPAALELLMGRAPDDTLTSPEAGAHPAG